MDQQQKDHDAVKRLREYARRHAGARGDAEFIKWVESVLKQISAQEWQRVKAIIDTPGLINVDKIDGDKIDGDRKRCDHCRRDYGLNYCHVCGGITCGNCISLHTHRDPTTSAARPGE